MDIPHKPGVVVSVMAKANEYPAISIPPLPEAVKERFPELENWQLAVQNNYQRLVDVLLRRDRAVATAAVLPQSDPTLAVATVGTAGGGQDGKDGEDGKDGKDGTNGKDGKPGVTGPAGSSSHSVLAYAATTVIDFALNDYRSLNLGGDVTFTTANLVDPKTVSIRIVCDATPRLFTFPAWIFVGGAPPAGIAAAKVGILTVTCFGATDAEIVAAYAVQV